MKIEASKLPNVDEAIEISIKYQNREKNRPSSWKSNEEESALLEMMQEGADEIYSEKIK